MITFFTIVLDGMPWITQHYQTFCQLKVPWRWIVVEGVADNVNCTSWCAKLPPRLSTDTTNEYLRYLCAKDERVTHISQPLWPGKVAMCNAALEFIKEPCLLWQVDSDELWSPGTIEHVDYRFKTPFTPEVNCAYFHCQYFVGPDRYIVTTPNGFGNHDAYEWKRVWRFKPGMRFLTHEPPSIIGFHEQPMNQAFMDQEGCRFIHMAYATEAQMQFKQRYYAGAKNPNSHLYAHAVEGWKRLQAVTQFPVKLKDYLPWVDDQAMVVHV